MPDLDLPTVIFALVALFVAWKLRSVLGVRQDSERPGGHFGSRYVAFRAPPAPPAAPSGALRPRLRRQRWPRTAGRAWPSPTRRSGPASTPSPRPDSSFSPQAFLTGAKGAYDMVVHAFAAGRFRRSQKPDVARGLRQFRECDSRPRRRRTYDVDYGRFHRQRDDRQRRACRSDSSDRRAVRRQARVRDARRAR